MVAKNDSVVKYNQLKYLFFFRVETKNCIFFQHFHYTTCAAFHNWYCSQDFCELDTLHTVVF